MEVNENLRMRQLLKVLAVSDVVVYKTRAERLHSGKTLNTNHRFYQRFRRRLSLWLYL